MRGGRMAFLWAWLLEIGACLAGTCTWEAKGPGDGDVKHVPRFWRLEPFIFFAADRTPTTPYTLLRISVF